MERDVFFAQLSVLTSINLNIIEEKNILDMGNILVKSKRKRLVSLIKENKLRIKVSQ